MRMEALQWGRYAGVRVKKGFGGAEQDRTADLLVANEALSQLSYSPTDDSPSYQR